LGSPCRISGTTDGLKPSAKKKKKKKNTKMGRKSIASSSLGNNTNPGPSKEWQI
jgi:hypothetical protein